MEAFDDIELFTDGSHKGRWGSWSFLIAQHNEVLFEVSGRSRKTDSTRMEFQAAIEALRYCAVGSQVKLHSDSRVLIDKIPKLKEWKEKSWRNKDKRLIPNADLLDQLYKLSLERNVTWIWVKAHSGNKFNERCDKLCTLARAVSLGNLA